LNADIVGSNKYDRLELERLGLGSDCVSSVWVSKGRSEDNDDVADIVLYEEKSKAPPYSDIYQLKNKSLDRRSILTLRYAVFIETFK